MKRTYIKQAFTDEELENLKNGNCWCGKPRIEFAKGMRVYCSPDHRQIWYSKTLTWQEFKNNFLRIHGEKCDHCGKDKGDDRWEAMKKQQKEFFDNIRPVIANKIIAKKLADLEERYEGEFQHAIDPANIGDWDIEKYCKSHRIEYPDPDDARPDYSIQFEVDHKIAIVNGGGEFDESNLQVLCTECHKKKTRQDLKSDSIPVNLEDVAPVQQIENFINRNEEVNEE